MQGSPASLGSTDAGVLDVWNSRWLCPLGEDEHLIGMLATLGDGEKWLILEIIEGRKLNIYESSD